MQKWADSNVNFTTQICVFQTITNYSYFLLFSTYLRLKCVRNQKHLSNIWEHGSQPFTCWFCFKHISAFSVKTEMTRLLEIFSQGSHGPCYTSLSGYYHYKDKTVMRRSYVYSGKSHTGKTILYWNGPQFTQHIQCRGYIVLVIQRARHQKPWIDLVLPEYSGIITMTS